MSDKQVTEPGLEDMSREDMMAALFAQMVIQQANMAMMLLGKVPHPHTGKTEKDIEAARMFIDQLEMLEVKTKGNLSREEQQLLKQSLMALRMAFVESVGSPAPKTPESTSEAASAATPQAPESEAAPEGAAADDLSKKKFSKKY